jgi:putative ABC transport system permease protein
MKLLCACYALALLAFPRRHRAAYAAEMRDGFAHDLGNRAPRDGAWRASTFAIAVCVNTVAAGIGERWRELRANPGTSAFSQLDFVLAWRMLRRYPGLSIISVLGISVGIAIAAGAYAISSTMTNPTVPLDEGDRVVSLMNWDVSTSNRDQRMAHDFTVWRSITSITDLSITRTVQRNLIRTGRQIEVVTAAEISATAFRVARVPALRGRFLLPEDEAPGAPDAMVIGYEEWVQRFDADPDIVGRSVQLGSTTYTIVGVMPDGFVFPLSHGYWIPWRIDASVYEPRSGPSVNVFGRLAPGATIESAQAELTAIGERMSATAADTHQHLRPRVLPYPYAYNDMDDPDNILTLQALQVAIVLMLVVVCVNVAILVYARTATRQGEIAVRGALGASRRRIVTQLFVEALLLTGIAAAAGVGLASVVMQQLQGQLLIVGGRLPFWMTLQLPVDGVLYIAGLTLLAAAIIGVAPALKATGRNVHTGLQTLSAGSGSRMQMGRVWTTLIVAQVAITVALMPMAIFVLWMALQFRGDDSGFASREFLTAQLLADRATEAPDDDGERAFTRQLAIAHRELDRRLREQSPVSDVTFSMAGVGEERALVLEVEGRDAPLDSVDYNIVEGSKRGHFVRFNRVATNFFEAYEVPLIMGRTFIASDAQAVDTMPGVLVNRTLVDRVFGGANPLGARIRYVGRSREANARDVRLNQWYEVVGVVPDFPTLASYATDQESRVYHAAAFGDVYPVELALRVRGEDPMTFANSFRDISAAVDPNLQLRDIATADIVFAREQGLMRLIGLTVVIVLFSVIGLAAAGMYALMSFTVSRRRKEIGIRAALGADRHRLLIAIFARALGQLGVGAAGGLLGAIALDQIVVDEGDRILQGQGAVILPIVAVVMMLVGVIAALGPARAGLKIQPIEALREE